LWGSADRFFQKHSCQEWPDGKQYSQLGSDLFSSAFRADGTVRREVRDEACPFRSVLKGCSAPLPSAHTHRRLLPEHARAAGGRASNPARPVAVHRARLITEPENQLDPSEFP
jgi:hypothetical protein